MSTSFLEPEKEQLTLTSQRLCKAIKRPVADSKSEVERTGKLMFHLSNFRRLLPMGSSTEKAMKSQLSVLMQLERLLAITLSLSLVSFWLLQSLYVKFTKENAE